VLGDIGETEIADEQGVNQDSGSEGDQSPDGVNRTLAADQKKGLVLKAATTEAAAA
jgi:hypothetical protein